MDRKFVFIAIAVALAAVIALAAIAGGGEKKDTGQTDVPDAPDAPETKHTRSIEADRKYCTMPIGQTLEFKATVTPADSEDPVAWTSSDASVATVTSEGKVYAVSEGTATVTASSGGFSASVTVNVYKGVTQGERNAASSAKAYLSLMPFSEQGLYDQLIYEKYTPEEARYGVEHCGADWYEQAVKKAQSYIQLMAFSKEGLRGQLVYDGFTEDQAGKAVDQVFAQ